MSEEQTSEDGAGVEELWSLVIQFREDEPWLSFGTHNADPAAILRAYDFPASGAGGARLRIHKTTVTGEVVDAEELREMREKESAAEVDAAVQSE